MPCVEFRRRLVIGRAKNHDQGTREPAIQRIQGFKFALLSTFKHVCQVWDRGCQVHLNRIGRGQYRPVRTGHTDGRALGSARRALRASFDEGDGLPHTDGQAHVRQHTRLLLPILLRLLKRVTQFVQYDERSPRKPRLSVLISRQIQACPPTSLVRVTPYSNSCAAADAARTARSTETDRWWGILGFASAGLFSASRGCQKS